MCILLWTTACSDQGMPLILLSNRDEFLSRPTQTAGPWESDNGVVYSGRDLARPEHGTWLGVNQLGRLAGLTNVRETTSDAAVGLVSRGAVVSSFLTSLDTKFEAWMDSFQKDGHLGPGSDVDHVGGFSMLCGQFGRLPDRTCHLRQLAVVSNRGVGSAAKPGQRTVTLDPTANEVYGLSNSSFSDPWPKVSQGKDLLQNLVEKVRQGTVDEQYIINESLEILSKDNISTDKAWGDLKSKLGLLPKSIFIPSFDTHDIPDLSANPNASGNGDASTTRPKNLQHDSSLYGTQKQTIIIVYDSGKVRYIEKTLFEIVDGRVLSEINTSDMTFDLQI